MTRISWQQNHNHRFETGIERGVLYPEGKAGVAWNGLTSVTVKSADKDVEPYYYDGLRYMNYVKPGDFSGELRALTYPDEFFPYDGVSQVFSGGFVTNQPIRETFGLSHVTLLGSSSGETQHRQIHFYYNLVAVPSDRVYSTIASEPDLVDFSWSLDGVPVDVPGHRPSVHFFVDSRFVHANQIALLEDVIYGTSETSPRLPQPPEIQNIMVDGVYFVDNGDGSWTAYSNGNQISTGTDDTFSISGVGTTYLSSEEYTIPADEN